MQQIQLFLNSIRSPETKKNYKIYFNKYLNFMGEQDLFCSDNPCQIERHMIDFIVSLKENSQDKFKPNTAVVSIANIVYDSSRQN